MTLSSEVDIELGTSSDLPRVRTQSSISSRFGESAHEEDDQSKNLIQIEKYPAGYPRFSALVASHESFHICRRFSNLRSRLLLLKQDKLSWLERELEKIDRDEGSLLYLGSCRRDKNSTRSSLLLEVDKALTDYDVFIERCHRILGYQSANTRDVQNLRNWVDGNGCIAREETAYLQSSEGLLTLRHSHDSAVIWLETIVENSIIRLHSCFGRRLHRDISEDTNVHIISRRFTAWAARLLVIPPIIVLLLVPITVCNSLTSMMARLAVGVISTASFITVLSALTKARTIELAVAGATYTTILVVFISSPNMLAN